MYDKEVKSSKQRLDMVFPSTRPKSASSSSRLGVGSGAGRAPQRGGRGGTRGSRRGFRSTWWFPSLFKLQFQFF